MYATTLLVHSLLRWVVLLAGFYAVARAWSGWRSARPWTPADTTAGRAFVTLLDIQMLAGLLLYSLSPMTRAAMTDFGAAMGDSVLRFWAVEHVFGMVVAIVLAHIGRAKVRRARVDAARFRTASLLFGLALVAILASIPWPFMPAGRPLW